MQSKKLSTWISAMSEECNSKQIEMKVPMHAYSLYFAQLVSSKILFY